MGPDSGAREEATEPTLMPMFPLGTVLVPGAVLPLHVFEPRYLALVDDVLAQERREFGVVLIARGPEVGGGDVRTDVGTVARLEHAERVDDGRWAVVAVGTRRLRVLEWRDDDPYPRAVVVGWPDEDEHEGDGTGTDRGGGLIEPRDLVELRDDTVRRLRQSLALHGELGDPVAPATVELAEDPVEGSFHALALAPIGPADRQRLLAAPGARARLTGLVEVLDDTIEVARARLSLPGAPGGAEP